MMNDYDKNISQIQALISAKKEQGILDSDLPFLFEHQGNQIGFLILHGSEASPCNSILLGEYLFKHGYTCLGSLLEGHAVNNNRGLHEGKVSWHDCYRSAMHDYQLLAGLVNQIYIIGSSFGGTLAFLMSVELQNKLSGIITIAAPTFTHANPVENWAKQVTDSIRTVDYNLHKVQVPTLILHGVDDKAVKVSRALHAFGKVRTSNKKLILYDNIGHNLGFGSNTEEVANDIINFVLSYQEPQLIRFMLNGPHADHVSLAGEFNGWDQNAHPMHYQDGNWYLELALKPGQYQYKFVINHVKWILDPNGEKVLTPLGEMNSLVKVE